MLLLPYQLVKDEERQQQQKKQSRVLLGAHPCLSDVLST